MSGTVCARGVAGRDRLLAALQRLMPLRLEADPRPLPEGAELRSVQARSGHLLVLRTAPPGATQREQRCPIAFADDADVPLPYRQRVVEALLPEDVPGLALEPGERVLARSGDRVLWAASRGERLERFRSALPLAALEAGQSFFDIFNARRCLGALCLLHYLRKACGMPTEAGPLLRAAFVIDDPNLHWPRYGPLDFRALAERAQARRFHVSVATVPLDAWFAHAEAVRVFREHRQALSLLVHGNDHAWHELALPCSGGERSRLLAQALARIERLEQRSGLAVGRVMVPPHGACSAAMLEELPRHGFEAACLSSGSLRAHNPQLPGLDAVGFAIAERIGECPVLPRWALDADAPQAALAAAYLGQALVFRAHPRDLRDGLDAFDAMGTFIESLGPQVRWGSLEALARGSVEQRLAGAVLQLQPLGLRHDLTLPDAAEAFVLQAAPGERAATWRWQCGPAFGWARPGQAVCLPAGGAPRRLRIDKLPAARAAVGTAPSHPTERPRLRLLLRRLAAEARDRFLFAL